MNQLALLDKKTGEDLRDIGMQQAVDHADENIPKWSEQALNYVKKFLEESPLADSEFMTEEVRLWAYSKGLPRPPHDRAWGGVTTKAARLGLITRLRIQAVRTPTSHCANATVWRKV
jgi:hypothetical protein